MTQGLHRDLAAQPDRIVTVTGNRKKTVRQVAGRVARLAGALRELGVRKDDRVAYFGANSDRFHEYYLATFWADAIVNPVNSRWTPTEISYSLKDSDTNYMFADETILPKLDEIKSHYPHLRALIWTGEDRAPEGALDYEDLIATAAPIEDARRGGDQLAGLFYTGGTTGFPKAVMLSHANLIIAALGSAVGRFVEPNAKFLHAAPMFHLADLAAWTIVTLTRGVHVTVPGFDSAKVFDAIGQHKVTHTVMVPAMLQALVDSPLRKDADMSSLQQISYGGSPITEAVLKRAQDAWPHVKFCQAYGQTELSPITTLLSPEDHLPGAPSRRLRSAGRAAPHSEVRVVDDKGDDTPSERVGEIISRGGHVMQGYWRRTEETNQVLRNGWLHSGDMGYFDADGYLYVVDRIKDMIITGGENVYSAEVENVVSQHPAVATCAVIGLPDEKWGERVHAVIALKPGTTATELEIQEHARKLISNYKIPRTTDFVDVLPISPTGKVLKTELRKKYRE